MEEAYFNGPNAYFFLKIFNGLNLIPIISEKVAQKPLSIKQKIILISIERKINTTG